MDINLTETAQSPPAPLREFRGVWVATVANIDWPSQPALTTERQKAEMVAVLETAARMRLNAVVLQVRPACDALYASEHEPWSEYLTGRMGHAPEPFYDPLAFAVEEAHQRGLELHAWFNPYRARHATATNSPVSPDHISVTHPHLVKSYGRYLWLDPGEEAVREHTLRVIGDVVRRYDIDGVHLDDYFYPYKEKDDQGNVIDFPDEASWQQYQEAGGTQAREDWRRENVNVLIERLYRNIKTEKPWVKFGISPFGIWRPGHPPQIEGFDAYAELYADARKWLAEGWVDYFTPQLYWRIDPPAQSYPALLRWWIEQNAHGRHLWPGNFTSRVGGAEPKNWPADEIVRQINTTRAEPGASGNIHFSMKAFLRDKAFAALLADGVYAESALVPASRWLSHAVPQMPDALTLLRHNTDTIEATWLNDDDELPQLWVVQARIGDEWRTTILPGNQTTCRWEPPASDAPLQAVAVSAVNRFGNISSPAMTALSQQPG